MATSSPQAAIRRKLVAASRLAKPARARNRRALPRAFFVTDPVRTPDPLAILKRLPRGFGVIWRHFGSPSRLATGLALARVCRKRGLILLVANDPALATRIGASGVHWPERQLKGVRARKAGWIETAAAHSRAAIARAAGLGVDAVLVSAVFPSQSPTAGPALGALRFRLLTRSVQLPVYALGGVSADNAARAMHNAAGWAAIEGVVEGWTKRQGPRRERPRT
jgi:thiamine-phosphate pyrophosphorylase